MATYLTQSLSISESLHASLSTQQQQHDQGKVKKGLRAAEDGRYGDAQEAGGIAESSKQGGSISLCRQCMLATAFIGVELSAAFTVTYSILFLQFLGVPTSLLSMQGVICGASAFILLPIIGWFSDRGPNPVVRKIGIMAIGYSAYVIGYIGVVFCSVWKLNPSNTFQHNSTSGDVIENIPGLQISMNFTPNTTSTSVPVGFILETGSSNITSFSSDNNSKNMTPHDDVIHDGGDVSFIAILGIISFALLDIAFDSCTSLCRAFVLECTPASLHKQLLVMATVFGAGASCLVGFVGAFDLPGVLGPMFHVDGTPATMLMFSCVIFFILTCCFACTLTVGYRVMVETKSESVRDSKGYNQSTDSRSMKRSYSKNSFRKSSSERSLIKASTESVFHKPNPSEPLLLPKHNKKRYHSTFARSFEKQNSIDKANQTNMLSHRLTEDKSNILHENEILDVQFPRQDIGNDKNDLQNSGESNDNSNDSFSMSKSMSDDEDNYSQSVHAENPEDGLTKATGISSILATYINSYSFSLSIIHNNYNPVPGGNANDERGLHSKDGGESPQNSDTTPPIWRNKRLMILCVSMFFTMGSMLTFSQYSGTVVTIGIIRGDPLAMLGSPERNLYDLGLRKAAQGNLVCFLMYSVSSLFTKTIIDRIGESVQYILCQIAFLAAFALLLAFHIEEVFFFTCAISGFYRACSFTLGYILANKFVQDECATGSGNSKRPAPSASSAAKNVGQVMVLIGMMLPFSYLMLSSVLGPLMSVTGSVFVPIAIGVFTTAMSLLVFCLLFFVKK